METLETILTRRSVRSFRPEEVDKDLVDKLLHAAMSAPSAHDSQPWHFIVIDDRNVLKKIAKVHPYAKMCDEAPLAIIPCVDLKLEKNDGFLPQNLAAATENILLAARDLGLGAVWVGVYPKENLILELRELFNLPENIVPFNVIPVGFTDITQKAIAERYQVKRIHYNQW